MKTSITFLALLFLFLSKIAFAQELPSPKIPEAEALKKYVDFPVDKSTGTQGITVPIYTLQTAGFSLPIALSYHTGGIRVDDMAGSVGLGWALQAGGTISRSVRGGRPDELGYYANNGFDYRYDGGHSYLDGLIDGEPDVFTFSVNGYSGRFLFDKNRKPHLIPEQDIKIETFDGGSQVGTFGYFIITTPDGVQYHFKGEYGYTFYYSYGSPPGYDPASSPTTWFLHKVVTPTQEEITFEYVDYGYRAKANTHGSVHAYKNTGFCAPCMTQTALAEVHGKELRRIVSRKAEVRFNYKASLREDIMPGGYGSARALENIEVLDRHSGTPVKKYLLLTSYFQSDDNVAVNPGTGSTSVDFYSVDPYLQKRLRLDAVQEVTGTGATLPPYKFSYNKHNPVSGLPNRLSNAQDHWGYYNGQSQNRCLIGYYTIVNGPVCDPDALAKREVNATLKKAFALDEVVFPTGGDTRLLYDEDGSPGLRVKQTITRSGESLVTTNRTYTYSDPILTGGEAMYAQDFPDGSLGMPAHPDARGGTVILGESDCLRENEAKVMNEYIAFAHAANYTGELARNHAYYERVDVREEGNGVTEAYYSTDEVASYVDDWATNPYSQDYPLVFNRPALEAGKLLREVVRREDGTVLRESTYEYDYYYRSIVKEQDNAKEFRQVCALVFRFYPLFSGYSFLKKKNETVYSLSAADGTLVPSTVTTVYGYEGIPAIYKDKAWVASYSTDNGAVLHHFVSKEDVPQSNGSIAGIRYKYPLDFSPDIAAMTATDSWDPASWGIKTMLERGMTGIPLEVVNTVTRDGAETVVGGKLNVYGYDLDPVTGGKLPHAASGLPLLNLKAVYSLETLPLQGFEEGFLSRIVKSGNSYSLASSSNYRLQTSINVYDAHSNLVEYQEANKPPVLLLWGYGATVPVAQAQNAGAGEVFYEGFEESAENGVVEDATTSHTGTGYYSGSGYQLSWPRPNAREYLVSFWARNGSTWVYREQAYTGPVTLTGGTAYDDIRVFPADAQVTSYAYAQPEVGPISMADAAGGTNYYEYDAFHRLSKIRDLAGDIVQSIDYHYNENTVLFYNTAQSGVFQKNDCPNEATGGSITYTVSEGRYSSPFSQAEADRMAQEDVRTRGQAYANETGVCTGGTEPYYNTALRHVFTTECPQGQTGTEVEYVVPAGEYSSMESQADADAQASADLWANGQEFANQNGSCSAKTSLEWANYVPDGNNLVTRIRLYDAGGATLLYDFGPGELFEYETYLVDRAVYRIVVEVQGEPYNSSFDVGYAKINMRTTTLNPSSFSDSCQPHPLETENATYTFYQVDLTNRDTLVFSLESGACN